MKGYVHDLHGTKDHEYDETETDGEETDGNEVGGNTVLVGQDTLPAVEWLWDQRSARMQGVRETTTQRTKTTPRTSRH